VTDHRLEKRRKGRDGRFSASTRRKGVTRGIETTDPEENGGVRFYSSNAGGNPSGGKRYNNTRKGGRRDGAKLKIKKKEGMRTGRREVKGMGGEEEERGK